MAVSDCKQAVMEKIEKNAIIVTLIICVCMMEG